MRSYPAPTRPPFFWDGEDDVETITRYTAGGYCPIILGNTFKSGAASYRILHKLGHGSFATVWLAKTLNLNNCSHRFVALKVCVANAHPTHEIDIHRRLPHEPERHVVHVLDHFTQQSPNGVHCVFVHDVLGSLLDLSSLVREQPRQVCKQIVQAVAFLHRHGVIHGDLHVGNVGARLPTLEEHSEQDIFKYFGRPEVTPVLPYQASVNADVFPSYLVPPISLADYLKDRDPAFLKLPLCVEVMDLGEAALVGEPPRSSCTPAAVCAPELMFAKVTAEVDLPSTFASDVWSLACTLYEAVLHTPIFCWASPNVNLLGDMAEICGEVPSDWRAHGEVGKCLEALGSAISPEAAEARWKKRFDPYTRRWAAEGVAGFSGLLKTMLEMDPNARPSVEEILCHPWLAGG